jgi:hypothetical protein
MCSTTVPSGAGAEGLGAGFKMEDSVVERPDKKKNENTKERCTVTSLQIFRADFNNLMQSMKLDNRANKPVGFDSVSNL